VIALDGWQALLVLAVGEEAHHVVPAEHHALGGAVAHGIRRAQALPGALRDEGSAPRERQHHGEHPPCTLPCALPFTLHPVPFFCHVSSSTIPAPAAARTSRSFHASHAGLRGGASTRMRFAPLASSLRRFAYRSCP